MTMLGPLLIVQKFYLWNWMRFTSFSWNFVVYFCKLLNKEHSSFNSTHWAQQQTLFCVLGCQWDGIMWRFLLSCFVLCRNSGCRHWYRKIKIKCINNNTFHAFRKTTASTKRQAIQRRIFVFWILWRARLWKNNFSSEAFRSSSL